MFVVKILIVHFLVLVAMLPALAQSENHASPYCPSMDEFNYTTQYHSKSVLNIAVSDERYTEAFAVLGVITPLAYEDMRLLQTEDDSAVCQKLNERFDDLDVNFVYDHEFYRYMPKYFMLYYEIQGTYVAFRMTYESRHPDALFFLGSTEHMLIKAFDKKNLNLIDTIYL